jgi:hypothetical protein
MPACGEGMESISTAPMRSSAESVHRVSHPVFWAKEMLRGVVSNSVVYCPFGPQTVPAAEQLRTSLELRLGTFYSRFFCKVGDYTR